MKYQENMKAIASLKPDYLGFIFYEKSPRNFTGTIAELPSGIKKTGVFVNASIDYIAEKTEQYGFKAIQLHGEETPQFCRELIQRLDVIYKRIEIFKVFSIKDDFNFNLLKPYEGIVDYFLFDTKGKEKGGNGYTFDWSALAKYPSKTPFILSGGIGLEEIDKIKTICKTDLPIYALDVNSKFETQPGLKNIEELIEFKKHIYPSDKRNKKTKL